MRLTSFSDYALRMLMFAASRPAKPFTIETAARALRKNTGIVIFFLE